MVATLTYKVFYKRETQKLHATVVKCNNLPKGGVFEGKQDAYVRVYLMPGTHTELKTKVVKSLNPTYNDEFSFVLSPIDVKKKTIVFQVYDQDTISKDDGLGEVQVPLWNIHDLEAGVENTVELGKLTRGKDNKPILAMRRPTDMSGRSSISSQYSTMERSSSGQRQSYAGAQSSYIQEQTQRQSYAGAAAGVQGSGYSYHESSFTQERVSSKEKEESSSSSSDEESVRRSTVVSSQGAMSLHELNNRLEKYIRQIHLTPDGPNVSIGVERVSEGGSFNIRDMPQYHEYERLMNEYVEQEEQLARVEAEIDILTHANQDYQERLRNLQMKIEEKRREITVLESKIKEFERERVSRETVLLETLMHNARVSCNGEKATFVDRLKSLQYETVTTTEEMVNEEQIRKEIEQQYKIRLDEEIEKIRLLYLSYEGEMKVNIKSIFDKKIEELKRERQHWSTQEKADVDSILDRLEAAKRRIVDLEKRKLDLELEKRGLKEKYEEEELRYRSQLETKKKERDWLQQQYSELYTQYSRYETDQSGYNREVARYSSLLRAQKPKEVAVHAEKFYDSNKMMVDQDGSSSSDSSEDEEYQRQKMMHYH